jgi:hypothetical protein
LGYYPMIENVQLDARSDYKKETSEFKRREKMKK